MTFAQLLTEFYARGFDFYNTDSAGQTRAKRFINEAYLEDISANEPWDFLRASTSGTAPLTISDLDTFISVRDESNDNPLQLAEVGSLEDMGLDVTETGTPWAYYLSSETQVSVYPANTSNTIAVRYYKVPTELSADADTPLIPSRWHGLVVDAAAVRAYVDRDNFEAAAFVEQRFLRRLERMRESEMVRSPHPTFIGPTTAWDVS